MDIRFIGTGSIPSRDRFSHGILVEADETLMIDCGEGIQHRLLQMDYDVTAIKKILITHYHIDHMLGVVGVVCLIGKAGGQVEIIGSDALVKEVKTLIERYGGPFKNQVSYRAMAINESYGQITTFESFHTPDALGFILSIKGYKLVFSGDLCITDKSQMNQLKLAFQSADLAVIDGVHIEVDQAIELIQDCDIQRACLIPTRNDVDDITLKGMGIVQHVNLILPKDFDVISLKEKL